MKRIVSLLIALSCAALSGAQARASAAPEYRLAVSFDIPSSRVIGVATLVVTAGQEVALATGRLEIREVTLNAKPMSVNARGNGLRIRPSEDGVLSIRYEGVFQGGGPAGDRNYGVVESAIDGRGISLTGAWYPQPEGLAVYRLTVVLPAGYEAVSEAEEVTKVSTGGLTEFTFSFPHPVDAIALAATDRYEVLRDRANAVELAAYFFKEDRELAKTYLQYAKKYIELYEKLLTPFPYKRFAVVENFLPTGYSLPTFTLLGQDVVRLPFIVETSLGHEVLHQWFGNSVYIDSDKGNWAEGLTSYLADHYYDEQKGKGWEHRKQLLINFGAYVNGKNDAPLRDFRGRTDFASRAIGYGKAAMVFHMLRRMQGDAVFFDALKDFIRQQQFQRASWQDIEAAFEKRSGKNLAPFFRQWLNEKGLPEIALENPRVLRSGSAYEVSFDVIRKGAIAVTEVPLTVSFLRGAAEQQTVKLEKEKSSIKRSFRQEPARIVLDEDYDVARTLTGPEDPPVIARLVGDPRPLIVPPPAGKERYQAVIEGFRKDGGAEKEAAALKDSDIRSSSLVVLGSDNPVLKRLYGRVEVPAEGFSLVVKKNPWNREKVVGIVQAGSAAEAEAAFSKVFHYGKYSSLSFQKGRNVMKKIDESERGIRRELREEAAAVDLAPFSTLAAVIDHAAGKKIVYVGELHDRFSHHDVEFQVIERLYEKNPKLAVGMEMFQRPFQKTLDDYVAGGIDERTFLKKSEYFKRWGFDYNLYKPILDFCREKKIPVIALNLRRELTEKVAKDGMDALTEDERKEIPAEMDFSDLEYRNRLQRVFEQHRAEERSFDFFLQAQVLWDETMAWSVDEFFQRRPDAQLVVLAGGGHVAYGAGIPKRAFRRNGLDYAVIMNDADLEKGIADYAVFPQPLDGITAPKLMATLKDEGGRVVLADFAKDSVSQKAGLKAGDVILALDGGPVAAVEDVRIALFYKKKEETVSVKVLRKRFLLGDKEMEIPVTL